MGVRVASRVLMLTLWYDDLDYSPRARVTTLPMKIRFGHYKITERIQVPELVVSSKMLNADIDFTGRFPYGWCAGIWLGKPSRWGFHWAWNAWSGEPNQLNVHLGPIRVDFSCFTWWKFRETGVRESSIMGRRIPVHEGHYVRCFPYPEDGWKLIRIGRNKRAA